MATIDEAMAKLAAIEQKVDALIDGAKDLRTKIDNIIDHAKKILDQTAQKG